MNERKLALLEKRRKRRALDAARKPPRSRDAERLDRELAKHLTESEDKPAPGVNHDGKI
jgi:hypothetical protein